MPALIFGTFGGMERVEGQMYESTRAALEAGYRHIDTAWCYGTEPEVGRAVKEFLETHPEVKRSDIFITTKLFASCAAPDLVEMALDLSLKNLGMDYVDCYLIHQPVVGYPTEDYQIVLNEDGTWKIDEELTSDLSHTWKAMIALLKTKKTRAIGVSNFTVEMLENLKEKCGVMPDVNQIESHPFCLQDGLVQYCAKNNIICAAYSALGSQGQVHWPKGKEQEAEAESKWILEHSPMKNAKIAEVAKECGVSVPCLLLSFQYSRGLGVLVKTSKIARVAENFHLIKLTSAQVDSVKQVGKGQQKRYCHINNFVKMDICGKVDA